MTCKGRVNRKRTVLKITIIIITILILLLLPPLLVILFESGTEIRWNMYMDGYRDYYRYRMEGRGFLFYLEREVVKKAEPANKPTPKYEEIVEDSYQLPF